MVIANNSRNREPAISIVVLKLPTVKGKRDSNIFLLVFEILNCYNSDKFNRINYSKIEKANHH